MSDNQVKTVDAEAKHENRIKELKRSFKYLLFASSAGLIQIISFTFLNEIVFKGQVAEGSTNYWISYLIALTLSVIWNFTFNRRYTFKSANNVPIAMLKVLGYYLVFTPLSTWWGDALTNIGWNEYIVLGGTMIINFVTEFTFSRFVVFGKSIDTNNIAQKEEQNPSEVEPVIEQDSSEK